MLVQQKLSFILNPLVFNLHHNSNAIFAISPLVQRQNLYTILNVIFHLVNLNVNVSCAECDAEG